MFDAYRRNRETGSFILVDRITHETVAAGMFLDLDSDKPRADPWDDEPVGTKLQPFVSNVSAADREQRLGQTPITILISGLSGSGKTTLARDLERALFDQGRSTVVLDGQQMRLGISRDLGFTSDERSENLRRAAEIAKLVNDAGLICIAAFVAPHADVRERVRGLIGEERFVHIHLSTAGQCCRQRDRTGRYLAADRGEITDFPGVKSQYQEPDDANLVI